MSDIVKQSDLKPVSFDSNGRSSLQVNLIVSLITKSISENKPINREDIIDTYMKWRLESGGKLIIEKWLGYYSTPQREWVEVSPEEYKAKYGIGIKAKQWFRSNLGSAIIKGKLLVIPIIEI